MAWRKIAEAEDLAIVETSAQAPQAQPRYIMLVAAPQSIAKESLLEMGRLMASSDAHPGLGIITGGTIESAEALWQRGDLAHSGHHYVASDTELVRRPSGPTIHDISEAEAEAKPLTKGSLISVLQGAHYLYWARHAGGSSWYWNSEARPERAGHRWGVGSSGRGPGAPAGWARWSPYGRSR